MNTDKILRNLTYDTSGFVEKIAARDLCLKILQNLKPIQIEILWRCVVYGEKHKDIAKEKGVTKQAISLIYCKAIKRSRGLAVRYGAFTDSA